MWLLYNRIARPIHARNLNSEVLYNFSTARQSSRILHGGLGSISEPKSGNNHDTPQSYDILIPTDAPFKNGVFLCIQSLDTFAILGQYIQYAMI